METLTYQFDIGEYQGYVLYDAFQAHSAAKLIVNPAVKELEKIARKYAFELVPFHGDFDMIG